LEEEEGNKNRNKTTTYKNLFFWSARKRKTPFTRNRVSRVKEIKRESKESGDETLLRRKKKKETS
jgi:hypothetical protein